MLHSRKGFTIVELMVVVIILGILASIGLPRLQASKEKAYLATARSDVRNAATAEEEYYSDTGTYGSLDQIQGNTSLKVTSGITMTVLLNGNGYQIEATSGAITAGVNGCEVHVGTGIDSATSGLIACDISAH